MVEPGASETAAASPVPEDASTRARERWFRVVLAGLILLVAGFTATLVANAFYPCEPVPGSAVQPPLAACAIALSPWLGVAALGLLAAAIGYLRVA